MATCKKFSARGVWEDQQPPLFIFFSLEVKFGKPVRIYDY